MSRILKIFVDFPKTTIVVLLLMTAFFGYQLKNLRFDTDTKSNLPENHPVFIYNDLVEDIFRSKDVIVVSVFDESEKGIFNGETLKLVERLTSRIEEIDGVIEKDVMSLSTIKNIVGTASGFKVSSFMKTVPESPEEIQSLRQALYENDTYIGSVVSRDGKATSILAKLEDGAKKRTSAYNKIKDLIAKKKSTRWKFYIAGRPVVEVTFGIYMQQSMQRMFPLVILVVILVLFLTFRSIRGVLLPLIIVIAAVIWALGIMVLCDVPLYIMSTNLPIILMAVGTAYGIHILEKYYHLAETGPRRSRRDVVVATVSEIWSPVVMTALTTAAGFASLITNQMIPIRYFGLFTAVGVITAMIFALTFLPAALVLMKMKTHKRTGLASDSTTEATHHGMAGALLFRFGVLIHSRRRLVLVATGLMFLVFLFGLTQLTSESSMIGNFQDTSEIMIADKALNKKFSGTTRLNVIFEGTKKYAMQSPKLLKTMVRLQEVIEKDEIVGGSVSIGDFVKRMNMVMNEGKKTFDKIPDSRDLVAQYLFLYSMSGEPGDFDEYVDYEYKKANIIFFLKTDNSRILARVVSKVKGFLSDNVKDAQVKTNLAGTGFLSLTWVETLMEGQILSILSSLLAVFLITAIMFRSLVAGIFCLIPVGGASLMNFGILGLLGVPMDVGTAISSGIIVGIGIDYTIHFIAQYRLEKRRGRDDAVATTTTMTTSGKAITFNALVVIAGFMVLFVSDFTPSWKLGVLVAMGMFTSFLMAMTLLPALINTLKPRFIFGQVEEDENAT
jgi:predicted RND superfamily exporter protein